jgi:hypothetical protein
MADDKQVTHLDAIGRIAERFGVPVVLLAVLVWFLRDAAVTLHSTVLVPVVKSHTEFLDSTRKTLEEIGSTQEQQAKTLQEIAVGQREIQQAVSRPPKTGATAPN